MSTDEFKIAKLELNRGDVLLVKSDRILDAEMATRLRERVQELAPQNKVFVIMPGIDFCKLTFPADD